MTWTVKRCQTMYNTRADSPARRTLNTPSVLIGSAGRCMPPPLSQITIRCVQWAYAHTQKPSTTATSSSVLYSGLKVVHRHNLVEMGIDVTLSDSAQSETGSVVSALSIVWNVLCWRFTKHHFLTDSEHNQSPQLAWTRSSRFQEILNWSL